ncbi:P-loop containing nucleoside triphosphate hydrolase protein [Panus rudis PR-1116 ss-1]|nr:P-loop containing nucleoside triphosphate hydrolase protein [Panus rudis PR-1116 ss-1]
MSTSPAVRHMQSHVLDHLTRHRGKYPSDSTVPPLFVAVQGPQGSGKTYLTSRLKDALKEHPHSLSVAVLSIDDLYLPHDGLVALAQAHPDNPLLRGRGQPGTHDIELGSRLLNQLRNINEDVSDVGVELPVFEKSLFNGEGDRLPEGRLVKGPIDIVLFEGWCVGFHPTSKAEIERLWELPVQGLGDDFFQSRGFRKDNILDVNDRLKQYVDWWKYFDVFIQIKPDEAHPYVHIYKWRLEQEHNMKAANGGRGMTDEQVRAFIDRYIPGYVFFGEGVVKGTLHEDGARQLPPWIGNGLRIQIDESRNVVDVSQF